MYKLLFKKKNLQVGKFKLHCVEVPLGFSAFGQILHKEFTSNLRLSCWLRSPG